MFRGIFITTNDTRKGKKLIHLLRLYIWYFQKFCFWSGIEIPRRGMNLCVNYIVNLKIKTLQTLYAVKNIRNLQQTFFALMYQEMTSVSLVYHNYPTLVNYRAKEQGRQAVWSGWWAFVRILTRYKYQLCNLFPPYRPSLSLSLSFTRLFLWKNTLKLWFL